MHITQRLEGFASVAADGTAQTRLAKNIRIFRVNYDARKVERAYGQLKITVGTRPVGPRIVRTVQTLCFGFVRLDYGVQSFRIRGRNADGNPAQLPARKPGVNFIPRLAAIRRFVQSRLCPARIKRPGRAPKLPERSIERVGVGGVHRQFGATRIVVHKENLVPRFAAIGSFIDSPLGTCVPQCAHHTHINSVGVSGVDFDGTDSLRFFEAEVCPALAPVGGAVNAIAHRYRVARPAFARTHPNHLIGLFGVNGDSPDTLYVFVEQGFVGYAPVARFPNTPARRADINNAVVGGVTFEVGNAARHERGANVPRS